MTPRELQADCNQPTLHPTLESSLLLLSQSFLKEKDSERGQEVWNSEQPKSYREPRTWGRQTNQDQPKRQQKKGESQLYPKMDPVPDPAPALRME